MHGPNLPTRILSAIQLRPMTVKELSLTLSKNDTLVRNALRTMESKGCVKRAGFAARARLGGAAAYLWRAA